MRWVLVIAVAFAVAGCGARKEAAAPSQRTTTAYPATRTCTPAGQGFRGPDFRTCWGPSVTSPHPTIERRTESGWEVVTGPMKPSAMDAQWGGVWLSPDRRMLLAEWQYPCDSAAVVFVSARNGTPRLVTGENDWRKAPIARALGWTREGKARVQLFTPWRGHKLGVYLFDPGAPARRNPRSAAPTGC